MNTALNTIAKTSIQLLLEEPFYGHYVSGLAKEVSKEIETACVQLFSKNMIKLKVNPDFWEKLNNQHRYGLIKHEVLHIVLKHLLTARDYNHHRIYNIAADIVVNQYILPEQLPEDGITIERFGYLKDEYDITLERNKDVGYYYNVLNKHAQSGEGEGEASEGDKFFQDLINEGNDATRRHDNWKRFEEMSPAEAKLLDNQINNQLKTTVQRLRGKGKGYDNLPSGLVALLEEMMKLMEPQVDWRRILRLFASSSNSTYIRNTLRRPSKRYGTTPGIKLQRRHHLLLAIDTSSSVSDVDLGLFFSEIYHIWRQGAQITVVECDTQIQAEYPYKGISPKITPKQIHGRGGTDFNHPLQVANERIHPDAIIYFTDGYAAKPRVPSRSPILWVITSNGVDENSDYWKNLPGKKLRLK